MVLLSCSASPSLATDQQKNLPPQKTAERGPAKPKSQFGFILGSLQGLEELPWYIPRPQELLQSNTPRLQGKKAAFAQGLTFSSELRLELIPCSTSPQTRGKPDSLPIMAISHPYMWLWSVEKETGLIFQ